MTADARGPNSSADAVHLRFAVAGDAAGLSVVAARLFEEAFAADNTVQDMADYLAANFSEAQQRQQIMAPDWDTLVAEDQQGVIAYAQINYGSPPACVEANYAAGIARFYVDSRAQGKGIAQDLLATAIRCVHQRGAQCMWLAVWEHNARAIAFYTKAGFAPVGDVTFVLGQDAQRDVVMQRVLNL